MIETRAPGKLFLAGEHAVVDSGEPALLIAVDRYLTVRLTELSVSADHTGGFEAPSAHVREAVRVVEDLRTERGAAARRYDLVIESELDDASGQKYGLGSSAAVTVAVVEALASLYNLGLNDLTRFRLALLATIEISPRASGGDLAASTFGGWVYYTSPDREALRAVRAQQGVSSALEDTHWVGCDVVALDPPQRLRLLVGWTGTPVSTDRLVEQVRRGREQASRDHAEFLASSRTLVNELRTAFNEQTDVLPTVGALRALLQRLSAQTGAEVETPLLRELCDVAEQHGAAAKPSGAGGGDCGIVLAGPEVDTAAILRDWSKHGILSLDLAVCPRRSRS